MGGANKSITNSLSDLEAYWEIDPIPMKGVASNSPIICTHRGIYNLVTRSNSIIPILMLYSPQASHLIISPNDAVVTNEAFSSWTQHADLETGIGHITFSSPSGLLQEHIDLKMNNNLWFLSTPRCNIAQNSKTNYSSVNSLRNDLSYKLWHHRLGHPGRDTLQNAQSSCTGVPKLTTPTFYRCEECIPAKFTKHKKGYNTNPPVVQPGDFFMMDYGFVRGSVNIPENTELIMPSDLPLQSCRNGYNCYLLITDACSRYSWIFLFADKKPPVDTVKNFLAKFANKHATVRTDKGGELAKSSKFREMLALHNYNLQTTASESSFQIGKVERLHQTLANMMRALLLGANLGNAFWSDAMLHAVYLKNRLPHNGLPNNMTPFEAWTGTKPDLSHLKVFGSLVYSKKPGIRRGKLDTSLISKGILLGFTPTKRNAIYYDLATKETKSTRHFVIDEAHYSSKTTKPPFANDLLNTHASLELSSKESPSSNDEKSPAVLPNKLFLTPHVHAPATLINLPIKGTDPTLGLETSLSDTGVLTLDNMKAGTPGNRIPRWRSKLRGASLLSINDIALKDKDHLATLINKCRSLQHKSLRLALSPVEKINSNVDKTFPQITFDQMAIMAHQHAAAKHDTPHWHDPHHSPSIHIDSLCNTLHQIKHTEKLTRTKLLQQIDWPAWEQSEFKQLDQYSEQNMFGTPCPPPFNSNILPLIWTYVIKNNGTKKARCVCNGSPKLKGSITLGNTYAASLEQSGSRLFWALAALTCCKVYGADATNAFAEAPPPAAPLYVRVDKAYRNWYTKHKRRGVIPENYVLPVNQALQGHPESPRLWANHIHNILATLNFKSCPHEPCLYTGTFNGCRIIFLRQVDDFAIASPTPELASSFLDELDKHLKQKLKRQGLLTNFNGLDVHQTSLYTKISCTTYLKKILNGHQWLTPNASHVKTPMSTDQQTMNALYTSKGPEDPISITKLELDMGFRYRQAIGELMFAAVTCRPDILFSTIFLSQYSSSPAAPHYKAVKRIFRYLRSTINDGLHFWRSEPDNSLPSVSAPALRPDNHNTYLPSSLPFEPCTFADADWAANVQTRKSVSGSAVFLAGAPITYKCRLQQTVALSSTESELYAACEAAKYSKYIRSVLTYLGFPLTNPTPIYEDNAATIAVSNNERATKRLRHVDLRHFAILHWVQNGDITLKHISTSDNPADNLTKPLGDILHSRHSDTLLGKRPPHYCHKSV